MPERSPANSALERAQLAAFRAALVFSRHPSLQWHAQNLKLRRDVDLSSLASRYGIAETTLARLADQGLDYPAMRFHRDGGFFDYFSSNSSAFAGSTWLDVGADTGAVDVYLSEMLTSNQFELCDVNVSSRTAYPVRRIAGTHLDYATDSFDLVFFTYVLHHAADSTIPLLRDAHRIARKHVVILEDPKETDADYYWAYKHDRTGTFRGRAEWEELFAMLDFSISHQAPLSNEIHSRHLYVLTPSSR